MLYSTIYIIAAAGSRDGVIICFLVVSLCSVFLIEKLSLMRRRKKEIPLNLSNLDNRVGWRAPIDLDPKNA
jgi:hypothetical protein